MPSKYIWDKHYQNYIGRTLPNVDNNQLRRVLCLSNQDALTYPRLLFHIEILLAHQKRKRVFAIAAKAALHTWFQCCGHPVDPDNVDVIVREFIIPFNATDTSKTEDDTLIALCLVPRQHMINIRIPMGNQAKICGWRDYRDALRAIQNVFDDVFKHLADSAANKAAFNQFLNGIRACFLYKPHCVLLYGIINDSYKRRLGHDYDRLMYYYNTVNVANTGYKLDMTLIENSPMNYIELLLLLYHAKGRKEIHDLIEVNFNETNN